MEHKINNSGDFESCVNKDCIWSATWSMGMICDHCKLQHCECPCPLTKQWIVDNSEKIRLQKLKDVVKTDVGTFQFMIEFAKKRQGKNSLLPMSIADSRALQKNTG